MDLHLCRNSLGPNCVNLWQQIIVRQNSKNQHWILQCMNTQELNYVFPLFVLKYERVSINQQKAHGLNSKNFANTMILSDVVRQESAQFSWVVCLAAQSPSSSSSSPSSFSEDSDLCPLEWTLTSISCLPITHSITALEVYLQLLTEPFLDARLSLTPTPVSSLVTLGVSGV